MDDANELEVDLRLCMETGIVTGLLAMLALLLSTSSGALKRNLPG